MRIAAVVVWYNPEKEDVLNIGSYESEVEEVIIVDNSTNKNIDVVDAISKYKKVNYIDMKGNVGLAKALNIGCQKAYDDGCDFVLTMDQDAYFEKNSVNFMKEKLSKNEISVLGPRIRTMINRNGNIEFNSNIKSGKENQWVITAGMILNLNDWNDVGKFDERLFIEFIDVEYCLKIYIAKKRVDICPEALLNIMQGNTTAHKILGKTVYANNGSAIRTFYLFRNGFYLKYKYGKQYTEYINAHYCRYLLKVLLFEKQKLLKFFYAFKGIVMFRKLLQK